jgi:hypothetical protein
MGDAFVPWDGEFGGDGLEAFDGEGGHGWEGAGAPEMGDGEESGVGLGFWGEEVAEGLGGSEEVLEFDFVEGFEDFKQLSEVAVGVAHGGEDGGVILGDDAGPEGGVAGGDAGGVAEAVAGAAEDGGV